jgi:ribonucleoside-diphosphate reductase alpha chain
MHYGPISIAADQLHAEKYRGPNESFREAMTRIAAALSDDETHFTELRDILLDMRFMPGGRIQSAVGSLKATTPYNCFVSGTIDDSYTEGQGSIMERAKHAAVTMRMGGGIGYDFSTLRPRGALIKKLNSQSSGPVSFMEIFDAVCRATASAGNRRGAQMGVLRIDHPDVEEFIRAKQNRTSLTGFNISLAVTDKFMQAVELDTNFELVWGGAVHRTVRARELWDMVMRSTYDWAEPGVLFIDRINWMNNLYYCETIAATNPCGEQPLPPYGACLLGSFNLVKYLTRKSPGSPWTFDYYQFFYDIPHVVRAMDNVIDIARYPLFEQEQEAKNKRRMGLGVTGLANTIEALGYEYGSDRFLAHTGAILSGLRDTAYRASTQLAKEKGSFPFYKKEAYLEGAFIQTLPLDIKERIAEHGMRNSHLLSIAPTGTISLAADNVSSGIEPVFAYSMQRWINTERGREQVELEDYGSKYLNVKGKLARDCTAQDHLNVLIKASQYVDSAVSKTCNISSDFSWDDFKDLYMQAWKGGCKGCTTYRSGGLREAILTEKESEPETEEPLEIETDSCEIDLVTGRRSCE